MPPAFAAFAEGEHRQRLARAQTALTEAGYDLCVSVAPEHLFYFAGYDSIAHFSPQALVFGLADHDEPTLILRDVDRPLALETSWVRDVRTYHLHAGDVPRMVAEVAEQRGLRGGRVAVELQSYALPGAYLRGLEAALRPATIEDASDLLGDLRVIKSPAELAYVRRAAGYAEVGLQAGRRLARAGTSEIELAGGIESAMRAAGCEYFSVPTQLTSGPRTPGGHGTPSARTIESGDLVHMEFPGVARRYHAAAIHTLAAGDSGPRARGVYTLALESLRAGMALAGPGVRVADLEEASLAPLRREGLAHAAMMRFGYGIGIAYAPAWTETLQIVRESDRMLAPGMAIVLHACIELPDEGIGVIQGATYLVTETGLEQVAGGGDVPLDVR